MLARLVGGCALLQDYLAEIILERRRASVDEGMRARLGRIGQDRNLVDGVGMRRNQIIVDAEFECAHGACGYACRLLAVLAQHIARVALVYHLLLFEVLRHAVRARLHAILAADAFFVIVLYGAVGLVDIHGLGRAGLDTRGVLAMVARRRVVVRLHRRELANFEVDHVAEQGANFKIVFIFAGDLAGLAANARILIEIEAHSLGLFSCHDYSPSFRGMRAGRSASASKAAPVYFSILQRAEL